jgi:hypothetical protein
LVSPFEATYDLRREGPGSITRDTTVRDAMLRLETLAKVMDSAIQIPGTKVVMGLDALLGLLPVAGDFISGLISSYLIWEARQLGAPRWLIARMSMNTALDTLLGSIPIVGDVFDVAYKSNLKNMALLRRHLERNGLRDARTIEAKYTVR